MSWTNKEVGVLRELYATAERAVIEASLPRHGWRAIMSYASRDHLRRRAEPQEHPHPIVRQLRARRLELGIKLTELAIDLGTDRTVLLRYETRTYPNMKRLIEWADLLGFDLKLEARSEDVPVESQAR